MLFRSEHHLLTGHTNCVLFVVIENTNKTRRQLGAYLWSTYILRKKMFLMCCLQYFTFHTNFLKTKKKINKLFQNNQTNSKFKPNAIKINIDLRFNHGLLMVLLFKPMQHGLTSSIK